MKKILLIGRPNVGKSTLFNRLCQKKIALVDDQAGVTRDIKMHQANLLGLEFIALDSAGWTSEEKIGLEPRLQKIMSEKSEEALAIADILVLVLDGLDGVTLEDQFLAEKIRKTSKPTIILINKSEAGDKRMKILEKDLYSLGCGEGIFFSAMHAIGLDSFYERLLPLLDQKEETEASRVLEEGIKISIVGRPNVGKSTLFNYLLGKSRALVSPLAGTTRDSISDTIELDLEDCKEKLLLIDTAGMRKKSRVVEGLEGRSLGQTITSIRRSNLVLLVMDATQPFEKQDLTIARIAINEGKALVFVVNKIDLLERDIRDQMAAKLEEISYNYLESIEAIPVVYISASQGRYIKLLTEKILQSYEKWRREIPTGQLNKWLKDVTTSYKPPLMKSRKVPINIKYITQKASQPPTFLIFANIKDIPTSYLRFLKRSLAKKFKLEGVPLRFFVKTTNNPYIK